MSHAALFLLAVYFIMDVTLHTTNNHGALSVIIWVGIYAIRRTHLTFACMAQIHV